MTQMDAEVRGGAGGTGSYPQMTQMDAELKGKGRRRKGFRRGGCEMGITHQRLVHTGKRGRLAVAPECPLAPARAPFEDGPSLPLGLGRTAPSRSRFGSDGKAGRSRKGFRRSGCEVGITHQRPSFSRKGAKTRSGR
jgi:hypothetical protein